MELKPTNHSYLSSNSNYYVNANENFGRSEYDTWQQFKAHWLEEELEIDHDYNHLFRFDIKPQIDEETEEESPDALSLHLYYVLQRKGIYRPVLIRSISEEDMPEIEKYLMECWAYLQGQWTEFSSNSKQ